jgi:hypothetical protein
VTVTSTSGLYGTPLTLTSTSTYLNNGVATATGQTASYALVSGPATLSNGILTFSGTSSVMVTASVPAGGNFGAATSTQTTITVGQAALTITASSPTVAYGAAVPAITPSYSGWVNGQSGSSLTTQPTCITAYATTSTVGSSPATSCSGAVDANYAISYVAGAVRVNQAALTITASSTTVAYGAAVPTITPTYSGFINGQTSSSLTTQPTCATAYTTTSAVGSLPSTSCSGAVDANYAISYVAGAVTVTQTGLTITASSPTVAYGAVVPVITPSYSGFVNGQSSTSLTMQPICTTTYTTASAAGSLPTTSCSGAVATNYAISYAAGAVTVSKAPLVITASSPTVAYGGAVPNITPSYSGFPASQSSSSLTTLPTCTTAYTAMSAVGSSPTTSCSGAVDTNYAISYVSGTVTVNQAALAIMASSPTVTYGATVPTITPTYSGFLNGQTSSSLTTQPACTTTYSTTSAVGSSPSTSCSGAESFPIER